MAILFVGNTAADFFAEANGTDIYDVTGTNLRDADYVNSDLGVLARENAAIPFGFTAPSSTDDFWLHFRVLMPDMDQASNRGGFRWFDVFDTNDKRVARVHGDDAQYWLTVYGDTEEDSATFLCSDSVVHVCDLHIERNGTTDVTATFYINGAQVATATAANTTAGNVSLERVLFENYNLNQTNSGSTDEMEYSEIICTDGEGTIGWRLAVLEPAADGFHTDFEGDYANVGDNDLASAIAAGSDGDKATFTASTYNGPATTAGIRAVVTKAVASRGDTGPSTLKHLMRIASTDYEGSGHSLDPSNGSYMEIWDDNPDTTAPWTSTDLASLEFGVKAET